MKVVARRILIAIPILFGVATLSFFLLRWIPGDPVDVMLGDQASSFDKAALRRELGLDLSLIEQYERFLQGLVKLDFGQSLHTHRPISEMIALHIPTTLELTAGAMALALTLGISAGVIAAAKRGSLFDRTASAFSLLGISLPAIWLGPVLILIFAIKLDWLPVSERGGLEHLVLPSLTLGLSLAASLFQTTRAAMLDAIGQDYLTVARAKGVGPLSLHFKHALANSAMPINTVAGLQFGALLTGTVIIETLFDWPGLGTLMYQAIQNRDYPVVQACVVTIASIYVAVNLATDIAYSMANPRVRVQ